MDEYSRIIIEEYCMNHPKTKKADFLWEMVHMSYDITCEPEPWQLMHLVLCQDLVQVKMRFSSS